MFLKYLYSSMLVRTLEGALGKCRVQKQKDKTGIVLESVGSEWTTVPIERRGGPRNKSHLGPKRSPKLKRWG